MIAIDKDYTTVVYSMGKCGTTSFTNALNDNWHYEGESNVDWYNAKHVEDSNRMIEQRHVLELVTEEYNSMPVFIIRDPWKRYVSGIKEITQDYISASTVSDDDFIKSWNSITTDVNTLITYIDKLFYLTQFPTNAQYRKENNYNWGRNFSLHENYHTKNWLSIISEYPDARVINNKNLDNYIRELGFEPRRDNSTDKYLSNLFETALLQCQHFYLIEKFIQPEIDLYKSLA
jgi:hypothetical protein